MTLLSLKRFLVLGFVLMVVASCGRATPESNLIWPTEEWEVSTPEEQGMDSVLLAGMLETIQEQQYQIDSVTVIRNGTMVVDVTVHPLIKHNVYSCTKSVTSILIGIAIDMGYIESVDQRVLDFFPDRDIANVDPEKEAMTLEHVLTMSTGLECRDSYLYRWRGLEQMRQSPDWTQYVLDLPMAESPGSHFEYCNGASTLLSAIIQETTGKSALEFAEEHLFDTLGISDVTWPSSPQGVTVGYSELRMFPQDMAKIGYLYLNEGQWNGEQVVSSEWVAASSQKHISATLEDGYGYQWWVDDSGMYLALGYRGQFIYVEPDKDLVVVFTSSLPDYDFTVPRMLLDDFILPAAISSKPLAENAQGVALLESYTEALVNP